MKTTTKELIQELNFKVFNPEFADVERDISGAWIHRSGLELAGLHRSQSYASSIIGWGTKENHYISQLDENRAKESIKNVVNIKTPLLVLSQGFAKGKAFQLVLEVANDLKVPVIVSHDHLSTINSQVSSFLIERAAEVVSVHASLAIVNGLGVMIKGPSGIGKSEALLELIQRGHAFVSDDTVELFRVGHSYYGKPAELTKGLLEARGIGIINIPFIYGAKSSRDIAKVELVVELVPEKNLNEVDRLGNLDLKYEVLDSFIPLTQIPTTSGRSIASLVEAAANVFLARKAGMDPLKEISLRNQGGNDGSK